MGYRAKRKTFRLVFPEDHDLHGLEIDVQSMTLGEVRDFQQLPDTDDFASNELKAFVNKISKWNLEDEDGTILPVCVDSLMVLSPVGVKEIVDAYAGVSLGTQVDAPLGAKSNAGASLEVASLPTETL